MNNCKRTLKKILQVCLAFILASSSVLSITALDDAEEELHYLVFASDYHSTEGSIENAMIGMPDIEYICLIGDMVGHGGRDATPEYNSSMILQSVQGSVLGSLSAENVAILWASHDANVYDDDGIVKCRGGYGSDVIYEGLNEDGSVAYYIYGIAHYEMTKGSDISREAAQKFKEWVSGIDHTIPVLVLCHVPMIAKRADNNGAVYWNEALNYAATGIEGIASEEQTGTIIRDVIFLSGHNHSIDTNEYYCPAGSTMNIQIDNSTAQPAETPAEQTSPAVQEPEPTEETEQPAEEPDPTEETEQPAEEPEPSEETEQPAEEPDPTEETEQPAEEPDPTEETEQPAEEPEPSEENVPDEQSEEEKEETEEETDENEPVPEAPPSRPRPPRPQPQGVISNVYYTSLTAGYLTTSGNASLLTIGSDTIVLNKYNGGENVNIGIDPNTLEDAGTEAVITRQVHIPSEIYIENTVDPTCEEDGHHEEAVYCTVCGKEMERTEVIDEAFGHDWSEWTVTIEPDYSIEGVKERVCSNDPSHIEKEAIPALAVSYTAETGSKGIWTMGTKQPLVITVQRNTETETALAHFSSIAVDGKVLPRSGFTINEGDGTIALAGSYLETLAAGDHSVTIQFDDGTAETRFAVLIPAEPDTPSDTEPEPAVSDTPPETDISDTVPETDISDTEPEAAVSDAPPEADVSDALPEPAVSDTVPEADISDASSDTSPEPAVSRISPETGDGNRQILYTSELILSLSIFLTALFCHHRYAGHN